ncbi:MAG: inositol monophosphatase family protein [Dongiaceae bacterium]
MIHRLLVAMAVAREAGGLAARLRAAPERLGVELKGPQDFVTAADRAVERLIAERLGAAFPDDGFLGEEGVGGGGGAADRLWVVDPIDGTANFVRGRAEWCVSIGLVADGRPALGVIYHPAADQLFSAGRGQGARRNGEPIRVSGAVSLDGATVGLDYSFSEPREVHAGHVAAVLARGCEYRRNGSAALSLAHVADGRLDGFVELRLKPWDVVAGIVLVEEAGGWASDFLAGDGLQRGNPMIAAAPGVRDALLAATGLEHWG